MEFKPMLAHPTDQERLNFDKNDYYVQPKLDGIRCYITKDGMFSRNHKPIVSAPHIFEGLQPVFEKFPEFILDGELYNHALKRDFEKIVSLVRKTKPTQDDLRESFRMVEFHCYDMYTPKAPLALFSERRELLSEHVYNNLSVVAVDTHKVANYSHASALNRVWLDAGYEGSMLRQDAEYQQKRSWYLQKVKEFKDEEAIILDAVEGKGKLKGKLGKFIAELPNGVQFGVPASAHTHQQRQDLWEKRDEYIGQELTFVYFEKTKRGVPRFPVLKAIRNYE